MVLKEVSAGYSFSMKKPEDGELITKRRHPIFRVEKDLMLFLFDIPPYGNVKDYKNQSLTVLRVLDCQNLRSL